MTTALPIQPALLHGPGLLSALATYRLRGDAEAGRTTVARLLDELQRDRDARDDTHVLLALGVGMFVHHPAHTWLRDAAHPPVLPRSAGAHRMPLTQNDVLVQVAAASTEERLHALRRAKAVLAASFDEDEELLGGRIGDGREAFGFRDGIAVPTPERVREVACIEAGPAQGATFLLVQRWHQDLERFGLLRAAAQDDVIGLQRDGAPVPKAPGDAHVIRAREYRAAGAAMIRRGFPFRARGEEGLAFVAASKTPETFRMALDAMLGGPERPDALLRYAFAVAGGLYVAPPSAAWLTRD